MNENKSEEHPVFLENNIFKVIPLQIFVAKNDIEKSCEEKLSIKNLSNKELILVILF